MADEYSKIMEPGRGVEHVVIEWLAIGQLAGQRIQARLVAEFVRRLRLGPNVFGNADPVTGLVHAWTLTGFMWPEKAKPSHVYDLCTLWNEFLHSAFCVSKRPVQYLPHQPEQTLS